MVKHLKHLFKERTTDELIVLFDEIIKMNETGGVIEDDSPLKEFVLCHFGSIMTDYIAGSYAIMTELCNRLIMERKE